MAANTAVAFSGSSRDGLSGVEHIAQFFELQKGLVPGAVGGDRNGFEPGRQIDDQRV